MEHNISLITTIAAGFGVALVFGFIAERLRIPALVGYLVAGILIGPAILVEQPLRVLAVIAIIIVGKSLAAAVLVIAFRYPLNTAPTVAASLAQIGEFSFILAGLRLSLGCCRPRA